MADEPQLDPIYLEQTAAFRSGESSCVVHFAGQPITIWVRGKLHQFEWHSFFGPTVLGKNGDPLKTPLPERHPFWGALTLWINQGMRVDENHRAIWSET